MTAKHKIMKRILEDCREDMKLNGEDMIQWVDLTPENIDWFWGEVDDKCDGLLQEVEQEYRGGEFVTDIPAPSSHHYESRSVATKLPDGSVVGWTYWYGGGKHGEPESIEWIEDAYDLEMTEEEKVVVVRSFKKKE